MHVIFQAVRSLYLGLVKARMRYRRHRHVFKNISFVPKNIIFKWFEMVLVLDSSIYNYLISVQVFKQK